VIASKAGSLWKNDAYRGVARALCSASESRIVQVELATRFALSSCSAKPDCCARLQTAGGVYSAARRPAQKAQLWLATKLVSWVGDGGMSDWKLPARGLKFCQAGTPGLLGVPNLAKLVQ